MSTSARRKLTSAPDATGLLELIRERRTDLTESIREFVELESPSDHKASVDRLGELLATRFETLGGRPTFHRQHEFGDHLQITFSGETGRPVLLLGHFDTVWELGSLQKMPWRVRQGRLWGPGVLDMKSGIALMLHAIVALRELREETGYEGENARVIGEIFPNPAIMSNTCYTVIVENCHCVHPVEFDHGEDLITHLLPVSEIPELLLGIFPIFF